MAALVSAITTWLRSLPTTSVSIENQIDRFFHGALTSMPALIFNWIKPFKTEISQLSWNLAYILVPFIVLLLTILILII